MDTAGVSSSFAGQAAQAMGQKKNAESGAEGAAAVLKKTTDIQKESFSTLLESLPDPDSRVGQNLNVRA